MRQKKCRRHSLTFKVLVVVPFCIALAIQGVVSVSIFSGGHIFSQMDDDAYDLFSERVASNAGYLENDMVFRWSNFGAAPDAISQVIDRELTARGNTAADITTGSEVSLAIIDAAADDLCSFVRRGAVDGAYLVLVNDTAEEGLKDTHTALYIRDSNPNVSTEADSDLMLASCPMSVGKRLGIALDSQWSPLFSMEAEGADQSAFYFEPLRAAQTYPHAKTADLGYWGRPTDLGWAGTPSITYSMPIRNAAGEVCAILGVEVRANRIETFFPYRDLNDAGSGSYLLTVTGEEGGFTRDGGVQPLAALPRSYDVLAMTGASQSLYVEDSSLECFLNDQERMTSDPASEKAASDARATVFATEIALYDSTSPFASDHWALVGLEREDELFSASHSLSKSLFQTFFASLVIGLGVAVLTAWISSSRLLNLMKEVRAARPEEPISFTPTGIVEVDELSDAIESLGTEVASAASRLSQILRLSDRSIGAFEYNEVTDSISYTDDFFTTLSVLEWSDGKGFDANKARAGALTAAEFEQFMNSFIPYVEHEGEGRYLFSDSHHTAWVRLVIFSDEDRGSMYGLVEDVTHEIQTRRRLEHERDHDILTGLMNRRAFEAEVTAVLQDNPPTCAAMLMFDLDNLKFINDTYGHDWGDQYIKAAAHVVDTTFRGKGFYSRISGDEFLVFVDTCSCREEIDVLFDGFRHAFDTSVLPAPDGKVLKVRASMGIALCPDDASDYAHLREYADFAMYLAKNSRKGELFAFDRTSYEEKSFIVNNKEELNRLLDDNLVDYHFQPIVDARVGEVIAYEALMRPQLESISTPDRVLALARSQSKLYRIEHMTFFGALEAFSQRSDSREVSLFVNSIATQCLSSDDEFALVDRYKSLLNHLVIEIIESDYSREMAMYKEALAQRLGARLAIDDFGSGYNGETSLLDYRVSFVKLDASIVRNIHQVKDQQDIARNLISYAHDRGIRVVAEGVETEEDLRMLLMLDVDYLQGYLIARPAHDPHDIADEMKQFIRSLSERS